MTIGITNATAITVDNVTQLANITDPTELLINVNHMVYDGWLYFILLWVFWVILFVVAQANRDQLLNNAMYSGVIVSVISIILRGITIAREGVIYGLITDKQLWVFPICTLLVATWIWTNRDR